MAARDITAGWRHHKDILVRGAGFAAAVAVVCGALAAGTILRDPSRSPSQTTAASIEPDGKDQTRVGKQAAGTSAPVRDSIGVGEPGTAPVELAGEWQEKEFTFVTVVDGRTFTSGEVTVRLAGLDLPPQDQVCRTLDNRLEPCAVRAATQLELLTRSRTLACRYRMTTSSEALGSCRIGFRDLAERMVRTGYVRAEAGRAVLADAGAAAAAAR
jgi:endonuclease YncB( thermonuclease family)